MVASPTDDTNALLLRNNALLLDILQGRNESSQGSTTLPSSAFSPSTEIFLVNVLFALSLALALVSSFIAVLGRQWLIYYRGRGGGGPESQRLDEIDRFIGARKWHLELILDDVLPSLLQVGLVIFCISLVIYLRTINSTLSYIVCSVLGFAFAIVIFTAICAGWDKSCPFQSPLARLASWCTFALPYHLWHLFIFRPLYLVTGLLFRLAMWWEWFVGTSGARERRGAYRRFLQHADGMSHGPRGRWVSSSPKRSNTEELRVVAIQRIISTSDEAPALLHAVANVFGIQDRRILARLLRESRTGLLCLRRDIYNMISQAMGSDHREIAEAGVRLVSGALAHIILSITDDIESDVEFAWLERAVREMASEVPFTFPFAAHLIPSSSQTLLEAYLAYMVALRELDFPVLGCLTTILRRYSENLIAPSWRMISVMAIAIASLKSDDSETFVSISGFLFRRGGWRRKLRAAYIGWVLCTDLSSAAEH